MGSGDGVEDGDRDDIRAERVSRVSDPAGKAASKSDGRSVGVPDESEACRAFASYR